MALLHGQVRLRVTSPDPTSAHQLGVLPEHSLGAARAQHRAAAAQLHAAPLRGRAPPLQHRLAGRLRIRQAGDGLRLLLQTQPANECGRWLALASAARQRLIKSHPLLTFPHKPV